MKKQFLMSLIFCVCAGVVWAANGGQKKQSPATVSGQVPAGVLPINISSQGVDPDTGAVGIGFNICSAMRLTSTVVLTAAHCVVDSYAPNSRIYAEPKLRNDGRWELHLASAVDVETFKKNAQVIYYRSGYRANGSNASHAFDFALIKLDTALQPASSQLSSQLQQAEALLQNLPQEVRDQMGAGLSATYGQALAGVQKTYRQFLKASLEPRFDLLEMTPNVVKQELQNSRIRVYFWEGVENSTERRPVQIFEGTCVGTDEAHSNTHTLLFKVHTQEGTSGSPFLDEKRHLVVSVNSGPLNGYSSGGLISAEVCQWVKQHAPEVKCLAVATPEGAPIYSENDTTAAWGK